MLELEAAQQALDAIGLRQASALRDLQAGYDAVEAQMKALADLQNRVTTLATHKANICALESSLEGADLAVCFARDPAAAASATEQRDAARRALDAANEDMKAWKALAQPSATDNKDLVRLRPRASQLREGAAAAAQSINEAERRFAEERKAAILKVDRARDALASLNDSVERWIELGSAAHADAVRLVAQASEEFASFHRNLRTRIQAALLSGADSRKVAHSPAAEAAPALSRGGIPPVDSAIGARAGSNPRASVPQVVAGSRGLAAAAAATSSAAFNGRRPASAAAPTSAGQLPRVSQVPSARPPNPQPAMQRRPPTLALAVALPIPKLTYVGIQMSLFPREVLVGVRPLSRRETPDLWETLSRVAWHRALLGPNAGAPHRLSLACLALPAGGWASPALLSAAVRVRYLGLSQLLHPDRWASTWEGARSAVPGSWAPCVAVDGNDRTAPVGQAAPSLHPPRTAHRRVWTESTLREAAFDALNHIRAAYEHLRNAPR